MDIDTRILRHFHALADAGSFARAARLRHISQPALSRGIQSLEHRLGVRLFERTSNGVELTDVGRLLLEQSRDLLARADNLAREMERLRGQSEDRLAVACGPYPADLLLGRTVGAFSRQLPRHRLQLTVADPLSVVNLVRRGEASVAIAELSFVPPGDEFEVEPLSRHRGYFVVRPGHPLLSEAAPSIARVLGYPIVLTCRLPARILGPLIAAGATQAQLDALPTIGVESIAAMKAIIACSDAVAPIPLVSIAAEIDAGRLCALDLEEQWAHTQFGLMRLRRRSPTVAEETFMFLVRETDIQIAALQADLIARLRAKRSDRGTGSTETASASL